MEAVVSGNWHNLTTNWVGAQRKFALNVNEPLPLFVFQLPIKCSNPQIKTISLCKEKTKFTRENTTTPLLPF